MVHGVRSLGSATMDLAYTAMGSFDIWFGCRLGWVRSGSEGSEPNPNPLG